MAQLPGTQLFDHGALEAWCTSIFEATSMPADDARMAAQVLVRTSLRGFDTHGVSRVPQYAETLLNGTVNPKPDHGGEFRDGVLYYRGDRGLGQVVGTAAVNQAVEIARETPVVTALLRQCGHLAALGAFVLMAAEKGMLAFICQSTTPWMGLPGWKGRAIGNNPLAFATPVPGNPPLVFDMASSVVASGYLRQAVREGTALPEGRANDPAGEPTTDAEKGWAGAVLPVGGYKGMGIAMLVLCLAGSLLGASLRPNNPGGSSEMSGFLVVINADLTTGEAYHADVRTWFQHYTDVAGADGRYPGQRAAESEGRRIKDGIPVTPGSLKQFQEIGDRLNVPFDVSPRS